MQVKKACPTPFSILYTLYLAVSQMDKQYGVIFKHLTTLGIGGPVREVITVESRQEAIETIEKLPSGGKFLFIGGGSNILVSDDGFDGTVIKNDSTGIERDKNILTVQSGTPLQELVNFANERGLGGLEKLAGIPGTVGGAIYGNAGAYGQTISDNLISVSAFDPVSYKEFIFSKKECIFDYRYSIFKKGRFVILGASFSLMDEEPVQLKKTSLETISKREIKYPPGIKCPGSFFQNIPAEKLPKEILDNVPKEFILFNKVSAGALLESVGAKGARQGHIIIAKYHANLFINEGRGRAEDLHKLAQEFRTKVYERYGIKLEPEVQFVNLPPLV